MPHATSVVHLSILLLLLLLLLPFLMLYLPSTDCFFRQRLEVLVIVVQLDSLKGSHCRIFKEAARHTRSSKAIAAFGPRRREPTTHLIRIVYDDMTTFSLDAFQSPAV